MTMTPEKSQIALNLAPDLLAKIDIIATATEQSRDVVIRRAIETYLEREGGDILAFQQGLNEVAGGAIEDAESVLADLDRIASNKVA